MTAWQKLAYGTLAAAGIALTGATIYQAGSNRRQVHPVDIIELMEGVAERQAALLSVPLTDRVTTNWMTAWAADPSGLTYPVRSGSNVTYVPYVTPAGSNAYVLTNRNVGLAIYQSVNVTTGRYIWGQWTNLTAVGFGGALDGAYTLRTNWIGTTSRLYLYAQVADPHYVLLDAGPGQAVPLRLCEYDPEWSWPNPNTNFPAEYTEYDDWAYTTLFETAPGSTPRAGWLAGPWDAGTGTFAGVGSVDTNALRDAAAVVTQRVRNALAWALPRATVAALDTAILALVPQYVDDSRTNSAGTFDDWFAGPAAPTGFPMMTVTGIFARLGIGDRTNQFTRSPALTFPALTNWVYEFESWAPGTTAVAVCYTADVATAVTYAASWTATSGHVWAVYTNPAPLAIPATNMPATYGDLPWQIYTNDLVERYRVLAALRMTPAAIVSTGLVQSGSGSHGEYGFSTNNFIPDIQAAAIAYGSSDPEPGSGAETYTRLTYASAGGADITGAEMTRQIAWYGAAAACTSAPRAAQIYIKVLPYDSWDAYSDPVTDYTNALTYLGTTAAAQDRTNLLAAPFPTLDNLYLLPEPHVQWVDDDRRGWQAQAQGVWAWQFTRCTNAP
jgi:hypothetical protein